MEHIVVYSVVCAIYFGVLKSFFNVLGALTGSEPSPASAVDPIDEIGLSANAVNSTVGQSSTQQLAELRYTHQIPRKSLSSLKDKLKAIGQFVHFIFLSSPEAKEALVKRNELTAEKLLKEYQSFIQAPAEERVERFIQWRDDMDYFEANKNALHSVKSNVVEFRTR